MTISLMGCPGTLDPTQFSGTAGTSGAAGTTGAAGTGAAGTGAAGTSAAMGCDITPILIGDATPGHCTMAGCHDAAGTSAAFSMVGDWQTHLVGVTPKGGGALPSVCFKDAASKTKPYIIKGSQTGDGLFLQKIKGPSCMGGLQMPFGATTFLSADQISCVSKWAAALATAP